MSVILINNYGNEVLKLAVTEAKGHKVALYICSSLNFRQKSTHIQNCPREL